MWTLHHDCIYYTCLKGIFEPMLFSEVSWQLQTVFYFRMITAAKTRKYSALIMTSRTWDIHELGIFYDTGTDRKQTFSEKVINYLL